MRHVVAPLDVAALLQCGKGCLHACLYVIHAVVPPGFPRYFEGGAAYVRTNPRKALHRPPHLLYLADAQFCLVEQDEMLVEVFVAVKHEAPSLQPRVPAGAPCLLHVVLQRCRNVVVYHQFHVALVHPHAERRGGDDYVYLSAHKGVLVVYLFLRVHLAVVWQCLHAVARQLVGEVDRAFRPRHIYYGGAVGCRHERPQPVVFLLVGVHVDYGVMQVGARGGRGEEFQVLVQPFLEIVADVLHHLLLCRGGETRHRDPVAEVFLRLSLFVLCLVFLLLVFSDEFPDIQVVHAEIMPPRREAVGFVDYEPHHVAAHQYALNGLRPQHFGGDVEQRRVAVHHPLNGEGARYRVEQSVYCHRVGDAAVGEVVHLVFHQRLQRGDYHCQSVYRPRVH